MAGLPPLNKKFKGAHKELFDGLWIIEFQSFLLPTPFSVLRGKTKATHNESLLHLSFGLILTSRPQRPRHDVTHDDAPRPGSQGSGALDEGELTEA